jgi:DNA invertase Pin-like site-specific DNA recombinase
MRVAAYLRVSTTRQAEQDLSIPDQQLQIETHCRSAGWTLVRVFNEPGASATDDRRPEFRRMIDVATAADRPFDAIVIHSYSRFFRETFEFEFYRQKLAKAGVELHSISQPTGSDAAGDLIRHVFTAFDEYSSRENAKHTLRAMKENARQGFWNGSQPPYGYRVVEAERRGHKLKKRLELDPAEAEVVREIYHLYQHGCDRRGPLGVKSIAVHLNARGMRNRRGGRFSHKFVHQILTRETYTGRHWFNQVDSRSRKVKDRAEWIPSQVPAIIDLATQEQVRTALAKRNPKKTPPRIVSGPTLLTGLARCASCGGGMTLRTGKSGRYRYYVCASRAHQGPTACRGRSMPMDRLDGLVTDHFCGGVLEPSRLKTLLSELRNRAARQDDTSHRRLSALRRELRNLEAAQGNLLDAVERGLVGGDSNSFRARYNENEARREELIRLIASLDRELKAPLRQHLDDRKLGAFAAALRSRIESGDTALRKRYLRLFIDRVEVDDHEIRIRGPKSVLSRGAALGIGSAPETVPSFAQEWRPLGEGKPIVHQTHVFH